LISFPKQKKIVTRIRALQAHLHLQNGSAAKNCFNHEVPKLPKVATSISIGAEINHLGSFKEEK